MDESGSASGADSNTAAVPLFVPISHPVLTSVDAMKVRKILNNRERYELEVEQKSTEVPTPPSHTTHFESTENYSNTCCSSESWTKSYQTKLRNNSLPTTSNNPSTEFSRKPHPTLICTVLKRLSRLVHTHSYFQPGYTRSPSAQLFFFQAPRTN